MTMTMLREKKKQKEDKAQRLERKKHRCTSFSWTIGCSTRLSYCNHSECSKLTVF